VVRPAVEEKTRIPFEIRKSVDHQPKSTFIGCGNGEELGRGCETPDAASV
jgi:hypothetical protein